MKHIEAGLFIALIWLGIILIAVAMFHFVGAAGTAIILTTTLVVGVSAAVIDYITEER